MGWLDKGRMISGELDRSEPNSGPDAALSISTSIYFCLHGSEMDKINTCLKKKIEQPLGHQRQL